MTVLRAQPDQSDDVPKDKHVQALQDENRLLFDQLSIVQEELERLHHLRQKQSAPPTTIIHIAPVDTLLIDIQAENLRVQALIETQGEVHALQTQHTLANQLGDILIQGSHSTGAMLSVPVRLHRVWRQSRRETPPKSLGGKQFDKVLAVYRDGGEEAVETFLARASVSETIQASAWTALARTRVQIDASTAAKLARRAYSLEPKPFRQKWLAFRLHEAGELLEAEALLTLLPDDMTFSESEGRQVHRLKAEAKQYRLNQARLILSVADRQEKLRRQWQDLAQSRDRLAAEADLQRRQLASLSDEMAQLRKEGKRHADDAAQLRAQCDSLRDELAAVSQQLQERMPITANQQREHAESLMKEVAALMKERDEQKKLAAQWFEQCVCLQYGVAELTKARDEQSKLAMERLARCKTLETELAAFLRNRGGAA